MPQAEMEENSIRQERQQSAAERRDRNARAIAEVVGRNPVKRQQVDSFSRNRNPANIATDAGRTGVYRTSCPERFGSTITSRT
jgi:hypothetical protein